MNRSALRWLPLSLVGALAAIVAALGVISGAHANPATVGIGSATVEPGASATVALTVTPGSGEQVGALTVDVTYASGLTISSCEVVAGGGVCNKDFVQGSKARFTIAATTPISGTLANLTFTAPNTEGNYALTVDVSTCANVEGGNLTCTASNGSITVAQATPTPTAAPTATPTAAPTATPKGLPQTGGSAGDSGSNMPWVLGTAGLAVLAAGVWALSRMRRESL